MCSYTKQVLCYDRFYLVESSRVGEQRVMSQIVKFLVLGLPQSGKSTFIKTISPQIKWQDNQENNWLHGLVPVDEGLKVHFMEPPALPDFDFLWIQELISEADVDGFIILMDSTDAERFGQVVYILQTVMAYHAALPMVLVANFQDQPNAWTAHDVRLGLGLPEELPVMNCVARQVRLVKQPVLELLYRVMQEAI